MRSYFPAIILSLLLHAGLILLVVWGWQFTDEKPVIKPPNYIKAALVELKAKTNKQPKKDPVQKQVAEKKNDQIKQQQEKQKREAKEKAKKRAQELKKNQLAKQKSEKEKAEKAKKEKQRHEREKQKKAEALKKQALANELAKEKERLQAEEDTVAAQSYSALIAARVERNWRRPPSARNGMEVLLAIQLVPTGQVISVTVIKSSGSNAFDRSAVRAIKKVDRFTEVKGMPSRLFENKFRNFKFSFNPQDLRQ